MEHHWLKSQLLNAIVFKENKPGDVTATGLSPETLNTSLGQDVTEVPHLVIAMLQVKILLITCRNM